MASVGTALERGPALRRQKWAGLRKFIVMARAGAGLVRRAGRKAQERVVVSKGHKQE